jgi:hypothetical protein
MLILPVGFEKSVRNRLGVRETELPDDAINDIFVVETAERYIMYRVPDYATIIDESDLFNLKSAAMFYVCALIAPTMARRVNIEVGTIDVKWKKANVKWDDFANSCLADVEVALGNITTVTIIGVLNYPLGTLANFQIGNA